MAAPGTEVQPHGSNVEQHTVIDFKRPGEFRIRNGSYLSAAALDKKFLDVFTFISPGE